MASVYALRLFIRSMHNRLGARARSYDIGLLDGAVLVPLIAVIVFLALYPQLALHRSEGSVKGAVASVRARAAESTSSAAADQSAHVKTAARHVKFGVAEERASR
ncbi:MAG: hypothetical protein E6G62_05145 [Actinobacteria bacterium]|nr:MAG: hypothetical protein E6G62_05145 [Actinomycetota bacterium]